MKRPSDQAKLLFLGLLRTATALATDAVGRGVASQTALYSAAAAATMPRMVPPANRYQRYQPSPPSRPPPFTDSRAHTQPVQIRLAKLSDVPSVSDCNLQTLPENYNHLFYEHHLQEWPDLALVAVVENHNKRRVQQPQKQWYDGAGGQLHQHRQQPNEDCTVVAYLLGKIQERPTEADIDDMEDEDGFRRLHHKIIPTGRPTRHYAVERFGHVSSLAVLPDYRRQGLAQQLLQQFHHHLVPQQCTFAGLHVRQSNTAAVRLYERLGYVPALSIPAYYEDGENAYYMKKMLPGSASASVGNNPASPYSTATSQSQSFLESLTSRLRPPVRVWETGPPELRLPRTVIAAAPQEQEEPANTELLTGTMY